MQTSKDYLASLLKTTQLGQVSIRSVLDSTMRPGLRTLLKDQLLEYDALEAEVHSLAAQRGWEMRDMDPAKRFMTDRLIRLKLSGRNYDSEIASLMIQGTTKNMIQSLKNSRQYPVEDEGLQILARKLIDCETAAIQQMRAFL
ncbi:MAG: hypothetical protein IKB09_01510 [Oscillospiraceae bacterium]|nr:hypothetical protein [Oscillospiraceae bacterium]